jgi:outer membrane protein assembly factor BamD (BamD/ComL family)
MHKATRKISALEVLAKLARTALDRGNALAALTTLADYDTAHPHGRLIEERDALRIQATWAAGQHEQARSFADAFKARYPRSLLLPAIEEIGR